MSLAFSPLTERGLDDADQIDLRITVVQGPGGGKHWRRKTTALDFRVHPDVAAKWGLDACQRVFGKVDEDGTWTLTRSEGEQKGFRVRVGGKRTATGALCKGRKDFAYFRFTGPKAAVRAMLKDLRHIECDLVDVDGRTAMFIPKVRVTHLSFQPA